MPDYKFGTVDGKRVIAADNDQGYEFVKFGTDENGKRVFGTESRGVIDFVQDGVEVPKSKPSDNSKITNAIQMVRGQEEESLSANPVAGGWKGLGAESQSLAASSLNRMTGLGQAIVQAPLSWAEATGKSLATLVDPTGPGLDRRLDIIKDVWTKPIDQNLPMTAAFQERKKQTQQYFEEDILKPKAITDEKGKIQWKEMSPISNPRFYTNLLSAEGPLIALQMANGWRIFDAAIKAGASQAQAARAAASFAGNQEVADIAAASYDKAIAKGQGPLQATAIASVEAALAKTVSTGLPTPIANRVKKMLGEGRIGRGVARVAGEGAEGLYYGAENIGKKSRAGRAVLAATTNATEELGQEEAAMLAERLYDPEAYKNATERRVSSALGGAVLGGSIGVAFGPSNQEQATPSSGIQEGVDQIIAGQQQQVAPVEQAPVVEQPKAPARSPLDIAAEMRSQEAEASKLIKRLGAMKVGSKAYQKADAELAAIQNYMIGLDNELRSTAQTITGPTGELNLSPEDIALLNEVMPTSAGISPTITTSTMDSSIDQRTVDYENRIKQLQGDPNAIQIGSTTEVGSYQGGPEGIGQEQGGGIRQGIEGQGAPQASQAQEVAGPFDIPQNIMDRAVQIRNSARIASTNQAAVPEGIRAGVAMRANEAQMLVARYAETVNQLGPIAIENSQRGRNAKTQIKVAQDQLNAGLKRIQKDVASAVAPHLGGIQQQIKVKLDGVVREVTDPTDVAEIQSTQQQVRAEIEQIKSQPMTSEQRKEAIAEVAKKVDALKQDVVKFPNTRKAIREAARGGKATSGGFLEIGAAIVQDLMAMGADSFSKFVQTLRAKLDARSVMQLMDKHNGLLNFYKQSREYLASSVAARSDFEPSVESINNREWFHGTGTTGIDSTNINTFKTEPNGLVGPGFYTTSDPSVSDEYMNHRSKKTGSGEIVRIKLSLNDVLNLEEQVSADVVSAMIDVLPEDYRGNVLSLDRGATGMDAYKAFLDDISEYSNEERVSKYEAGEIAYDLSNRLREMGYDAVTHLGGNRVGGGKKMHQVVVLLGDGIDGNISGSVKSAQPYKTNLAKTSTQTQTRTENGNTGTNIPRGRVSDRAANTGQDSLYQKDSVGYGKQELLQGQRDSNGVYGNQSAEPGTDGLGGRILQQVPTGRSTERLLVPASSGSFRQSAEASGVAQASKSYPEFGSVQEVIRLAEDPNSVELESLTAGGRNHNAVAYEGDDGKIHVEGIISNGAGKAPNFYRMSINDEGKAYVAYNTTGPRSNGYVKGKSSDMVRTIADTAKQFGAKSVYGLFVDGRAASIYLNYDGATVDSVGPGHVYATVPIDSIIDDMRQNSSVQRLMAEAVDQSMKESDTRTDATESLTEKLDELRGNSRIEYLSSGLNLLKAVDAVLAQAGKKTISEQLGLNWDTATAADYYKALFKAINGLGKTVQETAVRIKQKFRDVSMNHALKLAEFLHRGDEQKDVDEALKEFKSEKVQSDIASDQVMKRTVGFVSGWASRPAAIGIRNPIFKTFMEAVDKFMNTMNVQKNFAAGMKNAVSKMTNEQEKVDLAYVLAKGTLANDGAGRRFTKQELAAMGFSPEAISAYNQIIATTTEYQDRLREAAEESLKTASESDKAEIRQMIKALHNEAYWPLERFGSFGITLRDKNTGKAVGFMLVDGERRMKDGLKEVVTKETINAAVDQMAQQDPVVKELLANGDIEVGEPTRMPDLSELLQGGSLVFDAAMADYINAGKKMDEKTVQQLNELAGSAYIKRSLGQHLKNRKGTAGYSLDLNRVVDAIPGIYAKKIARLTHGDSLAEAHKALDPNENKSDTRLYDLASEIKRSIMNPGGSSEFSNAALKYGYVKGLAGVISSGFVNALQSYTMGLPVVGNFYGYQNATKSITKALATASGIVKWSTLKSLGELDSTESGIYIHNAVDRMYGKDAGLAGAIAKVLVNAAASGEMQPKFTQELFNQERDTLAGKVKSVTDTWVDVLGYTMAKPEEINRVTMLMVAAEMAVKQGVVHTNPDGSWELQKLKFDEKGNLTDESADDLSKFATIINDVTNFAGSRGKRSRLELALAKSKAGQLVNIPLQFTSYPIQSAMTAHAIGIMNAAKATTVGGKIGGYSKPLVAQALVATAIGGPLASTFAVLLSSALKSFDMEEWDKWFGRGLTEDLTKAFKKFGFDDEGAKKYAERLKQGGVPGLVANISLKGALQPGLNMSGESAEAKIGRKFMGIVGADVVDAVQGIGTMIDTDAAQGLRQIGKALEPRFVKGIREGLSGEASFSGAKEGISKYESLLRILGFQPARIAEMREKSSTDFEMFAMMQGKLKDLKAKAKSEEDATRAIELMQDWNDKHDDPKLQFKARDFRSVQTSMPNAERRLEDLR